MYLLWRDSSRLKKATNHFNPINEKRQVGCYSQSKALATQAVLDACRERGLKGLRGTPERYSGTERLCDQRDNGYGHQDHERQDADRNGRVLQPVRCARSGTRVRRGGVRSVGYDPLIRNKMNRYR